MSNANRDGESRVQRLTRALQGGRSLVLQEVAVDYNDLVIRRRMTQEFWMMLMLVKLHTRIDRWIKAEFLDVLTGQAYNLLHFWEDRILRSRFGFACGMESSCPTNRNLSSFVNNAERVNPPHSIYRIWNLCSSLSKKCGGIFGKKAPPSSNVEDWKIFKKTKTKVGSSGIRTRDLSLTVHCSTHYSIPPHLIIEVKIVYIKTQNI